MSKKRLRRLAEFPGPIVITEEKDYTWVIETREVDDAGEPFGDWEVWTAFPAEGKKLPQYPEKNPVLAGYLKECGVCDNELEEPGAVLLSPPDPKGRVDKYHICTICFSGGFCLTDRGKLVPDVPWEGEQ